MERDCGIFAVSQIGLFRSKEEELRHLSEEVASIKATLKEVSTAVGRIERHVKRSFGILDKKKGSKKPPGSGKTTSPANELPTMTREEALSLFDELSVVFRKEGPQEAKKRLGSMTVPDLKFMAHELGVTFSTKPSKKALFSGIVGRLNEREMLSKNVNITFSQKEQMQKNGKENA